MEAFEEAAELAEAARDPEGRGIRLAPAAAEAWRSLASAASRDRIELTLISGLRTYAYQRDLVRAKLASGEMLEAALQVVAPPGYSEHHTGFAADIGSPGTEELEAGFDRSPAYAWLQKNAPGFGWRLSFPAGNAAGYVYEPWHWRFWPSLSKL
ncbi:MAG TPA: M15 family metallopeptidase [Opitutaceae bacterium]|nr:M15 family metallopeptidase [Opitutaceae bacterium]